MTNKSWIVTVEEDNEDNLIIPFPEDMIEQLGWKIDDILEWEVTNDGVILTNKSGVERHGNIA